jgi:glycerol-3-phosphate dehydrogenase
VSRLVLPSPLGVRPGWRRAVDERHDLLVVGGGIHGAGVARDAALRGLRVALIERDDWAAGTSSRSSKLLHGGLRYLREGRVSMVREALRERELHRRLAPGHVRPLRFRVPPVPPGVTPRWLVRSGIALYGLLSGRPQEARFWEGEPVYEDAALDDARFTLEVMLDARRHEALAVNFVEWLEWVRERDRIVGARARDRLSGEEGVIRAEVYVNAAGPWAGIVRGRRAGEAAPLRLTRGTHVVLDRRADDDARLFFSPVDGRVLFLLPFGAHRSLLGATDLDESAPTRDPIPLPGEVGYLREAFHRQFPEWSRWRPVSLMCGIRPLLNGRGAPSQLSREVRIDIDPTGRLISILGGKYTTYRAVAERVVDRVETILGRAPGYRPTRREPIPGPAPDGDFPARIRRAFGEEDAVRLEDVFLRRTDLGYGGEIDPSLVRWAAKLWRLRWGVGESAAEAEIEAFQTAQERRLGPLEGWSG